MFEVLQRRVKLVEVFLVLLQLEHLSLQLGDE